MFRGRTLPRWVDAPRADYALPVIGGVAAALGLLFLQRDLGPALVLGLLFLSLYAIARGRIGMPLAGLERDTALSAYLARPDQRSYDLADLTLRYLKRELKQGSGGDNVQEELLFDDEERNRVFLLRSFLGDMPEVEAIQFLLKQMSRSKSNKEFFQQMVQGA